uniref:Uncharacterized protein n=1 Tax=Rhizophora mucronata TaxID=61149 RepID=A0A2P2QBH9_RHIMU
MLLKLHVHSHFEQIQILGHSMKPNPWFVFYGKLFQQIPCSHIFHTYQLGHHQ